MTAESFDTVLVVDFGAQYAQLIARRVREAHVYSRSCPHTITAAEIAARRPAGVIFSGGPASVHVEGAPRSTPASTTSASRSSASATAPSSSPAARRRGRQTGRGEYGRTELPSATGASAVLGDGVPPSTAVWMSHFDTITARARGLHGHRLARPTRRPRRSSTTAGGIYGVQFHPEVVHTPHGQEMLKHFLYDVCGCRPTWTMASIIETSVDAIRAQVGDERVICGLSGGVDSAVAAALVHKAIGPQLTCVFVDTGLMREGEGEQVVETFHRHQGIELIHVRRGRPLLRAARRRHRSRGEAQGDRRAVHPRVRGGRRRHRRRALPRAGHALPRRDRVGHDGRGRDQEPPQRRRPARRHGLRAGRAAAQPVQGRGAPGRRASSACPTRSCGASRSPGPGSACASSARSRPTRSRSLQHADAIVREEMRRAGLEREIWQAFAVLPDIRSVGRDGRRAHLRAPDHHPRRHERGRHDRRLGPAAVRPARAHVEPDHQRGAPASTGSPTTSRRSRPGTIEWE